MNRPPTHWDCRCGSAMTFMETEPPPAKMELADKPALFVVWIDQDIGLGLGPEPDWAWNSAPQPLRTALEEARDCRVMGFPACVCKEGENPRADGDWSKA